jgi:hypothetical protein
VSAEVQPDAGTAPAAPAFTMLGDATAVVCTDEWCAVPGGIPPEEPSVRRD